LAADENRRGGAVSRSLQHELVAARIDTFGLAFAGAGATELRRAELAEEAK
jgi:hypothetical protein